MTRTAYGARRRRLRAHGLADRVRVTGYVPDEVDRRLSRRRGRRASACAGRRRRKRRRRGCDASRRAGPPSSPTWRTSWTSRRRPRRARASIASTNVSSLSRCDAPRWRRTPAWRDELATRGPRTLAAHAHAGGDGERLPDDSCRWPRPRRRPADRSAGALHQRLHGPGAGYRAVSSASDVDELDRAARPVFAFAGERPLATRIARENCAAVVDGR